MTADQWVTLQFPEAHRLFFIYISYFKWQIQWSLLIFVDSNCFIKLHKSVHLIPGIKLLNPGEAVVQSYPAAVCFLPRFYAGGSERSGQQIVGPPRKKSPNELVEDLFKGAKEHGAVAVDRTAKSSGESSKPKVRSAEFLFFSPLSVALCCSHLCVAPTVAAVGYCGVLKLF